MDFSLSQRIKLGLITNLGWIVIWLIGPTLRYRIENWEDYAAAKREHGRLIFSFWHNQIFAGMLFWRRRHIVVMTSAHFDGEYIARIIHRFGYGTSRGSSTRGGIRAVLDLSKRLAKGLDVAFTIDGPKGPVYKVKPGPIWLSRKTGVPIFPFHFEPRRAWKLRSWDGLRIPKPFSPVVLKIGKPFVVPPDGQEQEWLDRLQSEMDRLRKEGEQHWATECRRSSHRYRTS
jgi:lysophospholipid acyltransferase (LPLAT)-like uncharacterized protein